MKISIVCVNWNSTDCVQNLLNSLKENPFKEEVEFILVDNNSNDFDDYSLDYPNLKLIKNSENLKYARGNNQGIKIATGDYILLFNPDIKVRRDSINILFDFLEKNKEYFAACPKLILPTGERDLSVRGFPYPLDLFYDILKLYKISPKFDRYRQTKMDYNIAQDVDQPMTSALLIRKSMLDEIGYFDEDFPIFFNDVDLLFRAKAKGFKVKYLPKSEMDHIHGASTKRADKKVMQYNSYTCLLRFFKKHFSKKNSQIICIELLIKTIIKIKGLHP